MRFILFISIILTSCGTTQNLPSGDWSGYLSHMNQPDKQTSLNYRVKHLEEQVSIDIYGPGGVHFVTKDLVLTRDTLYFSYNKKNDESLVSCALQKLGKNFYHGKCTDPDGKWAVFTMKHNSSGKSGSSHFNGIRCACH